MKQNKNAIFWLTQSVDEDGLIEEQVTRIEQVNDEDSESLRMVRPPKHPDATFQALAQFFRLTDAQTDSHF